MRGNVGQDIKFSFDEALSLEGNSGPYLQYTYARARSVLAKSSRNRPYGFTEVKEFNTEEEVLLRTLYRFEEAVVQAADELAPNLVANFLYDLAQKYNSFYNKHRVIGNDFRLWLTDSTAQILQRGLGLLGISAPEKM